MWFFSKNKKQPDYENAYSVLNKELERLHKHFQQEKGTGSDKNINIYWSRINELQEALLKALEKQPLHTEEIRDLQNTVADILLLTETESK